MVAIFTGVGTGFERGSGSVLGGAGLLGAGVMGRAGEQVMLNAANGNLMISRQDEYLVGRGPDAAVARTYNSLGDLSDDNGDNWRQSTQRRILDLIGPVNSWGSSVKRITGDGTHATYGFDGAGYVNSDGAGAYDRISYDGSWRWTDGDSRIVETYNGPNNHISQLTDANGNTLRYDYAGDKLATVTTANGEQIRYEWSGNNLTGLVTRITADEPTATHNRQLYWLYDAAFDRGPDFYGFYDWLSRMKGGMSFEAVADQFYNSSEYAQRGAHGMSNEQFVEFAYQSILRRSPDGGGRASYLNRLNAGLSRGSMLGELALSGEHQQVAASIAGRTAPPFIDLTRTRYEYDGHNRLANVVVDLTPDNNQSWDGNRYTTSYTYHGASKLVASITQTDGSRLDIGYDGHNRVTSLTQTVADGVGRTTTIGYGPGYTHVTDPQGQTTALSFDGAGQLVQVATPPPANGQPAQTLAFAYNGRGDVVETRDGAGAITRLGYDERGNLTARLDPDGTVTIRTYDAGNRVLTETVDANRVHFAAMQAGSAGWEYGYDPHNIRATPAPDTGFWAGGAFIRGHFNATAPGQVISVSTGGADWFQVVGGERLAVQTGIEATGAIEHMDVSVHFLDAAGNYVGGAHIGTVYGQQGYNTKVGNFVGVPAGAVRARLEVYCYSSAAGGGNFLMVQPSVTTAAPGQTIFPGFGSVREGTPPATTRYAYDGAGRLRYVVDAEGGVTEFVSDGAGQHHATGRFAGVRYDTTGWPATQALDLGAVDAWQRQVDKSSVHVTHTPLDGRGNVVQEIVYGSTGADGSWQTHNGYTHRYFTRDQAGQVLSRVDAGMNAETFAYDGLGRVVASTDAAGATTRIAFQDGAQRTVVTLASGMVTTSTFNRAGELVAEATGGHYHAAGSASYAYDSLGRLRVETDATGLSTAYVYDRLNRKVAEVNRDGWMTEYRYDAADRLVATVRYTHLMAGWQRDAAFDPNGSPQVADLRPPAHGQDIWLWNVWDAGGRLVQTIGGDGSATIFEYDASDRLVRTTAHANKLEGWRVDAFKANAPAGLQGPPPSAADSVERRFYDRAGRLVGTLDGEGRLSRTGWDAMAEKIEEVYYGNLVPDHLRAHGSFAQLVGSVGSHPADAVTRWVYDGQGHLRFEIDALNRVTEYGYEYEGWKWSAFGPLRQTVRYAGSIASLGSYTLDGVRQAIANAGLAGHGGNRTSQAVYDGAGRLIYAIDPEGAVTGYRYDTMGNVVRKVDYADRRGVGGLPDEGGMNGWDAAVIGNPANRITRSYYSASGQLRFTVDGEGYVTRNDYDAEGRLTFAVRWNTPVGAADWWSIDTVAGNVGGDWAGTTYGYNVDGRLSRVTDGNGVTTEYWYWANGTLAWEIAASGMAEESRVHHVYDGAGREVIRYDATWSADQMATHYAYDGRGNLVTVTDAGGRVTTNGYDRAGQLVTVTDAIGGVTSYGYDALGNRVRETDARGATTWRYHDKAGRVVAVRDAENYVTETSYTVFGEVAAVTRRANASYTGGPDWPHVHGHPADATTRFQYDRLGRATISWDAEGHAEQRWYDAFGNIVQEQNKAGGMTRRAFDRRGLMVAETLPAASWHADGWMIAGETTNRFEYDARGNMTRKVEAAGLPEQRTTRYAWDKANRLVETRGDAVHWVDQGLYHVQGASEPVERRRYDARGNLVELTDARGARTLMFYDKLGRKTEQADATGGLVSWRYDGVGNLTHERRWALRTPNPDAAQHPGVTGEDRVTDYTYDRLDRMTSSIVRGVRTGHWNGSYYYTGVNDVTTTYDYDATGNVLRVVDGAGNAVHTTYDRLGRRTRQVDAEGFITGWLYDAEGNVHHERRWAQRSPGYGLGWSNDPGVTGEDRVTDFTHDRMGRRTSETRRGVVAFAADGNGNLYGVSSDATVSYSYNGLGQVTRRAEATGEATVYEYDAAGRLAHETRAGYHDQDGVWTQPLVTYRYNGLGDVARTEQTRQGGGETRVVRYGYTAGGRLHTMTDATGTVFTYWQDIAGAEVIQTWNRNRSDGSVQHEGVMYTRDALGRVQSQATGWHNGQWNKGDVQETRYNVFGEVSQRGINGLQEDFAYDKLGNLARTNSGDGVWRYFVSDGAGRRTITLENQKRDDMAGTSVDQALHIASNWSQTPMDQAYVDGVAATIAVYDRRGQQVGTRLPNRELRAGEARSLELAAGYNPFGELAWERDATGATTHYAYNTMGRRTWVQRAAVTVTDEAGNSYGWHPTENLYYDAGGRLVGQDDANGRRTTRHLLAGTGYGQAEALVTAEFHADGGVKRFGYDRFGDQRRATDEIGRVTTMHYDAAGRLIQQIRPSGHWDYYGYDVLGQRLWHVNSHLGWGERETSDYDHQGRVTSTRAFGGEVTSTSYGWIGHLHTGGMGTFGGWQQTTNYASGFEQVEQSDVFGHVVYSHDHMPGVTIYTTATGYDRGGRMVSRSGNDGETVTYRWHNTGLLAYQGSDLGSGYERAASHYDYDAAGRKVAESFARDGIVYTQSAAAYDALGRMTWWHQNDTALPWATMTWSYDAVGNIRRTTAEKAGLDQWGNAAYRSNEDRWFRYDAMNRVTLDGGVLSGGTIVRGWSGASLAYDAAGQRVSSTRDASLTGTVYVYDPYAGGGGGYPYYYYEDYDRGQWVYRDAYYQGERRESFGYGADGQLSSVSIAETGYYDDGNGNAVSTGTLDRAGGSAAFHHDGMGRQVRQLDYNAYGQVAYDHEQFYSAAGRVDRDITRRLETGATLTADTWNDYGWNGAVAGGQVVSATTYSYRNDQHQGTTSYSNGFSWRNGGAQIAWTQTSGQTSSYTSYGYGTGGRLETISISDGRPRTVYITGDLSGQALTRDEYDNNGSVGDPHERWYRFNGNELGHVGNDGTWASDYAGSIQTRGWVQQNGAFGNNRRYGQGFSKSIDQITSYEQGAGGGGYTVRAGDTLSGIAAQVWGDASLWYKLAAANGLGANSALTPGQTLTLPAGVIRSTYNADQLRPYDPADAIGDVSPVSTQPTAKAKKNKCGAFGKILLVAVAVAVSVALPGGGTVIGAAVNGMIGSAVSQAVGLATGIQDKFSWKGVALAGLSGAIGGAVGGSAALQGIKSSFVQGAVQGAVGSALTQGIAVAIGLQSKFDFAGVAVAGIVGGVGGWMGAKLPGAANAAKGASASFGNQLGASTASAIAGAAVRSLVAGTSFGDNILAVLPDVIGTTIGRLVGGRIADSRQERLLRRAGASRSTDAFRELLGDTPEVRAYGRTIRYAADHPNSASARTNVERASRAMVEANADHPQVGAFLDHLAAMNDPKGTLATTIAGETAVSDIIVNGSRDYLFGSTVDKAGIWVGQTGDRIARGVGQYIQENPGIGVALALAEGAFAVVAPVKYLGGQILDAFKEETAGYIASKMEGPRLWSSDLAQAGGRGFVLAGSLVLGGLGALRNMPDLRGSPLAGGGATGYDARAVGDALEARYPGQVTSTTLPSRGDKNVGLAGTRHPDSRVVFDARGFPIFDDHARFDTRIGREYSSVPNSSGHMRAATRDLRDAIARGSVDASTFTPQQLRAIQGGRAHIPDLTWHHHQDVGRMQLVPTPIHRQTGHVGGFDMWYR